jgi:hypothetical protein
MSTPAETPKPASSEGVQAGPVEASAICQPTPSEDAGRGWHIVTVLRSALVYFGVGAMPEPRTREGAFSRWAGYIHADTIGAGIRDYLVYTVEHLACFWSGPRIGHEWEGESSMFQKCRRCEKTWLANW